MRKRTAAEKKHLSKKMKAFWASARGKKQRKKLAVERENATVSFSAEEIEALKKAEAAPVVDCHLKVSLRANAFKPKVSLVPTTAIYAAARAFGFGAKKYAPNNYKLTGLPITDLCDSVMRHTLDFKEGIETDHESGLAILDHAIASMCMLIDTYARIQCENLPTTLDDRFKEVVE